MKKLFFLLMMCISCIGSTIAQHTIKMRHLWIEPQVHVVFNGYTVSFTIRDINKALAVAESIGDSTYGDSCGLDSAKGYTYWLSNDPSPVYKNYMEPLLQNGVGVYLISIGHAEIRNKRHKKLNEIILDPGTVEFFETRGRVKITDPKHHQLIFSGKMNVDMYGKDIGLDM